VQETIDLGRYVKVAAPPVTAPMPQGTSARREEAVALQNPLIK
jgi:hypothetical protein